MRDDEEAVLQQDEAADDKLGRELDERRDDDQVLHESKAEEPDFDEQELKLA